MERVCHIIELVAFSTLLGMDGIRNYLLPDSFVRLVASDKKHTALLGTGPCRNHNSGRVPEKFRVLGLRRLQLTRH